MDNVSCRRDMTEILLKVVKNTIQSIIQTKKIREFAENNFKFDANFTVILMARKHWEKEKLLVLSICFFFHGIF